MKKHRKIMSKFLLLILIISLIIPSFAYADDNEPNFVERAFSKFVRLIADGLYFIIPENSKLDVLLYNKGQEDTMGLTLLARKNGQVSNTARVLFKFYLLMQFIAVTVFAPLGILLTLYILKASINPQMKSVLKDKILRYFITAILITSMPQILDIMLMVNSKLVGVTRSIATSMLSLENGFLMEEFKQIAVNSQRFVESITYLMCVLLNYWFMFVYYIRDITISFLFIFFPIIALLYPYRKGAVVGWFKEMFSNIFTQPIHGLIMIYCVTLVAELPPNRTIGDMIYPLTAFAMVIPMTGLIKRFLGMEGSVGAGKSVAGLGMLFGAYGLAKGVIGKSRASLGNVTQGVKGLASLPFEKVKQKKGLPSFAGGKTVTGSGVTSTLPTMTSTNLREKRRQALKQIGKGVLGLGAGTATGVAMGLGMSVFGAKAGILGFGTGYLAGSSMGEVAGTGIGNTANAITDGATSFANTVKGKKEKADLLLKNTEYGKKLKKAKAISSVLDSIGMQGLAQNMYAMLTPENYSREYLENLQKLDNLKMYQDKNRSVIYSDEDGKRKIHWVGAGNPLAKVPTIHEIKFNDGSMPDEKADNYKATETLRKTTGFDNILSVSSSPYKDQVLLANTVDVTENLDEKQLKSVKDVDLISEEKIKEKLQEEEILTNKGYAIQSKYGTNYYRLVENKKEKKTYSVYVGSGKGNKILRSNELKQAPIKYIKNGVYRGNFDVMLDYAFDSKEGYKMQQFDTSKVPEEVLNSVKGGDKIIIKAIARKEGDDYKVSEHYFNASTMQYLGERDITKDIDWNTIKEKALELTEKTVPKSTGDFDGTFEYNIIQELNKNFNSQAIRIEVLNDGTWIQHSKGELTDKDVHFIKNIAEREKETLQNAKAELEKHLNEVKMQYAKNPVDVNTAIESL